MRQITNRRGKTIKTLYTDEEMFPKFVAHLSAHRIPTNEFTRSMLEHAKRGRASSEQSWYMHDLVMKAEGTAPPPDGTVVQVLPRLAHFLLQASEKTRDPMVKLAVNDVHRIGLFGKMPSRVCRREADDDGWTLLGRLYPDGRLVQMSGRLITEAELNVLTTFDVDPGQMAQAHGLTHGWCCFCSLPLSADASVTVGYGPVCADKYGLPWGPLPRREKVE